MDIKQAKFMEGFIRLTVDTFKKGWHKRNGGNLTYRIKDDEIKSVAESLHEVTEWRSIGNTVPDLAGEYFLVTGSGKYMRNVELAPEENIAVIKIDDAGDRQANCRRTWRITNSRKN